MVIGSKYLNQNILVYIFKALEAGGVGNSHRVKSRNVELHSRAQQDRQYTYNETFRRI
jgi:hypothetical protein